MTSFAWTHPRTRWVYDDAHLVAKDPRVNEPGHLGKIWMSDYWPAERPSYNYRPLTTTSFAIVDLLGLDQRLVNIILHAACSVLVFYLILTLGFTSIPAAFAGALFALHPLHSEALYLVVGRGELLATSMGLLFLLGFIRKCHPLLLLLLFTVALFAK